MSRQLAPASPLELLPPLEEEAPVELSVALPELELDATVEVPWLPLDKEADDDEAEWLPVDEEAVEELPALWLPLEVELEAPVLPVEAADDEVDDAEVDEAAVLMVDEPDELAPDACELAPPLEPEHAAAPSAIPSQTNRYVERMRTSRGGQSRSMLLSARRRAARLNRSARRA